MVQIEDIDAIDEAGSILISICMITYAHERFIAKAVEGVLAQQVTGKIELIISDDCSPDETRKLCKELQKNYPEKIRLLLPEHNIGMRQNFSQALGECRGRYIAICEGDDYWTDPLKLQKQLDYLEAHPECVMTYHDARIVDTNGTLVKESKVPPHQRCDRSPEQLQELDSFILTLSLMFRHKPILSEMPPEFYRVLNLDNFLTSILGAYGSGHYMAEVEPAVYRVHSGGIWSSQSEDAQTLTKVNTWMWMASYYNRIGRHELAQTFIDRVNKRIRPMPEYYRLRLRRSYQWFARVMGWIKVSLPH